MPINYEKETPLPHRFWESFVKQTQGGSGSVAAGASTYKEIQPPVGETWLIFVVMGMDGPQDKCWCGYYKYDGTTEEWMGGNYGGYFFIAIIDNSNYIRLYFTNDDTSTWNYAYGYSVFKL